MHPHSNGVRTLAHLNDILHWPDLDVLRERFWSKVERGEPHACWMWQGWWDREGRGRFHVARKIQQAARVAYVLSAGPIPDGQCVRHLCHEPRCVNPAHLRLGTQAQNMADMQAAGRARNWGWAPPYASPSETRPVPPTRYRTLADKVEALVARAGPDECWLWMAGLTKVGYGTLSWQRGGVVRRYLAHRVAWEIANGPIAAGLYVLHLCEGRYAPGDNTARRCCNPAHLCLGTPQDNSRQCRAAGRAASGERNGTHTHPERHLRGTHHPNAKLTTQQVVQIRERRAAGIALDRLAATFGVAQSTICRAARAGSYRDL